METNFEDSKIKNLEHGTVIYEKSSTGQVIANVIPKKRIARKPPIIQEMKHCPIDESNVENVLDRMFLVTESLQQILQSYKDDLKKTGGGFVPRPSELRPPILKKRLEIAEKLTSTYDTYRQAVDDIAEMEIGGGGEVRELAFSSARKSMPKWPKIEVKNKTSKHISMQSTKKPQQQQQQQLAIRKPTLQNINLTKPEDSSANKKLVENQMVVKVESMSETNTQVSNDLLMSCENCVEEDVYAKAEFYDSDSDGMAADCDSADSGV